MSNYSLRKSQQEAINKTVDYFFNSQELHPSFLWNCVMRWGKCLTSLSFIYQYNEKAKLKNKPLISDVLILSFFPSTEDSWSRLLSGGIEAQDNFKDFNFITVNSGKRINGKVNIFFTSFQEIYTGKSKKEIFYKQKYQLLILDEYHYGSWNGRAKATLKQCSELADSDLQLKDKFENDNQLQYVMKLNLSGTPYKSTIKEEYSNDKKIFRFTYFDEQKDRLNNPNSDYKDCPQLELYSVSIQTDEIRWKDKVDFLFKNNDLFNNGKLFIENKNGASFWLVPSVSESDKIEKYINSEYSNFNFNIINLCHSKGNTLTWLNNELKKNKNKRNIILSYNKLTLGVTIPEIENVVFLREVNTAELYMQAGCRGKSQYKDKSKKTTYLISFDLDNDFSIFQQITERDVSEEDFIKLLPINFVRYNPKTNISEISKITGRTAFLDALSKIPLREQIQKTVSGRCRGTNFAIPDDILEALNKISSIGSKRTILTKSEMDGINARKNNELKKIEKEGFVIGCRDKEYMSEKKIPVKYPDNQLKQNAFEKGYRSGFDYDSTIGAVENGDDKEISDQEEKDRKESNSAIINKIQILIQRFLYILIGDYYIENRFPDIKNVPTEYFASLLGFDPELFNRLYTEFIIDNDYINNIISSFKSKENANTPYLGLSKSDDYEFVDLTKFDDKEIEESKAKSIEKIITEINSLADIDDLIDEKDKLYQSSGTKYIYIAKPSEHLLGLITFFNILKNYLPIGSPMSNKLDDYISYYTSLASGVKIGETHRDPSVRCDELNGYTDKHILFDIFKFEKVGEDKSDIDFHKFLESRGYQRIDAGTRRELFNMKPETAFEELKKYINNFNLESYIQLSDAELIDLVISGEITKEDLSLIRSLKKKK